LGHTLKSRRTKKKTKREVKQEKNDEKEERTFGRMETVERGIFNRDRCGFRGLSNLEII